MSKKKGANKAKAEKVEEKKEGRLPRFDGAKPGSTIERVYKDKTIKVAVKEDGFHYEGNLYTSLSKIASDITGASTNGPLWFGLRGAIPGARRAEQKIEREAKMAERAKEKAAKQEERAKALAIKAKEKAEAAASKAKEAAAAAKKVSKEAVAA